MRTKVNSKPVWIRFQKEIYLDRLFLLQIRNGGKIWIQWIHEVHKLKLNGGDITAVQGDSGHAQADMVTEVYSHIIDEDRRRNATLLEDSFYNRKNLNPQIHDTEKRTMMEVPEGVDAELLAKVLSNPEMAVLLTSLAKSMQGEHN